MSQTPPVRIGHLRRFSDEVDALASRADGEAPTSASEVEAIFAEHAAECLAPETAEHEADAGRRRAGRGA